MTELERRYERLLRLYPAAYRQTRGAEMLAVLVDSAPADRRRPEWRQVRGLIVGALRIRAGAHERRSMGQSWRMALRTAALMLLMQTLGLNVAERVFNLLFVDGHYATVAVAVAVALACLLAMVAIVRGAYLAATLVMTGAFVLQAVAEHRYYHTLPWQLPLAVALVMPLIGRRRVVVPWALNLMVPLPLLIIAIHVYAFKMGGPFLSQIVGAAVYVTLTVAVILWSTVDERVAMSFGLAFLSIFTSTIIASAMSNGVGLWMLQHSAIPMVLSIVAVIAIAVGATVGARRARV